METSASIDCFCLSLEIPFFTTVILVSEEVYYPDCGRFNSPAAEKEIQKYERFLGFHFPDAYRQFLKFSNGAWILKNEIYGLNSIGTTFQEINLQQSK